MPFSHCSSVVRTIESLSELKSRSPRIKLSSVRKKVRICRHLNFGAMMGWPGGSAASYAFVCRNNIRMLSRRCRLNNFNMSSKNHTSNTCESSPSVRASSNSDRALLTSSNNCFISTIASQVELLCRFYYKTLTFSRASEISPLRLVTFALISKHTPGVSNAACSL